MKEIKRLTNAEMENVAGGVTKQQVGNVIMTAGTLPVAVGLLASTGLHIGGVVCSAKAKKALANGDSEAARKFVGTSEALNISALSVAGAGVVLTAGTQVAGKLMGGRNLVAGKASDLIGKLA